MSGKLEEIIKKFVKVALLWVAKKQTGTLSLTFHLRDGGISDWHIQTTGKGDSNGL